MIRAARMNVSTGSADFCTSWCAARTVASSSVQSSCIGCGDGVKYWLSSS